MSLSWVDAFRIMGPAFLVSVALVDPGNWATAIEAGSRFGYELVWVVVASNLVAILLQTLAARLGIVTGKHLAQVCRESYPPQVCALLWALCEVSIVALDLTMLLGTAIGLNLLLGWPLLPCILLTGLDALLLLLLVPVSQGVKKSEALTVGLLAVVVACFLVDLLVSRPPLRSVAGGLLPRLRRESVYTAVSLLGANVMPHNFYLHSALVAGQARGAAAATAAKTVRALCLYNFLDIGAALGVALVINVAVLLVSAATFHSAGVVVHTLQDAHDLMEQTLSSSIAPAAFGTALLCAGQLSTFTGTIAGQVVLQGFLNIHMPTWLRRLITRTAAIIPAAVLQAVYGDRGTYKFLLIAQVVLALQLPVTLVPLIKATSSRQLMGAHASSRLLAAAAWAAAGLVFIANLGLFVTQLLPQAGLVQSAAASAAHKGLLDKDGPLDAWLDALAAAAWADPGRAAGLLALALAAAAFLALQLWMLVTPLRVAAPLVVYGGFASRQQHQHHYQQQHHHHHQQEQHHAAAGAWGAAGGGGSSTSRGASPRQSADGGGQWYGVDAAANAAAAAALAGAWVIPRSAIEMATARGLWSSGSGGGSGRAGTSASAPSSSRPPHPVTRGGRRQFALLLDEFWSCLYDAHGLPVGTADRVFVAGGAAGGGGSSSSGAGGVGGGAGAATAGGKGGGKGHGPSSQQQHQQHQGTSSGGGKAGGSGRGKGAAGAAASVAAAASSAVSPLVCGHTEGSHLCMGCSQALFEGVQRCLLAVEGGVEGAEAALWGPWPLQLLAPQANQTYAYHRAVLLAARNADFCALSALCAGTFTSTLDRSRLLASTPITTQHQVSHRLPLHMPAAPSQPQGPGAGDREAAAAAGSQALGLPAGPGRNSSSSSSSSAATCSCGGRGVADRAVGGRAALPPPTLSSWCLFGPAVLVSFGVWCAYTLLQWCAAESRPELWGRYAAVLNRLQGVVWDSRLDQNQQQPAPLPASALRLCPAHLALLRRELAAQLAGLEGGGTLERRGPADTAAGEACPAAPLS
eukprot:XP_001700793.1 predicted protein [Chlamydomonas reinhardtii]